MFSLYEKINNGQVYIIAEMSANHGGSLDNALKIVREAARAGADCLKIQTYTADSITINCDSEDFLIHGGLWDNYKLYDLYTDAGTPYEWQAAIKHECEQNNMDFLSTPFDCEAVDFLESIGCEAYKIASFELVDIPLIEYAASKGKPMIMSCGMANENEIQAAIEACKRAGNTQIVLLKCCSEYPANLDHMHLANIVDMQKRFGLPVGLSDHSPGSFAPIIATTLGAQVIEKHIKLEDVDSADSKFSMTVSEFANMVKAVHNVHTTIGSVNYGPSPGEKDNLKFRRSLFAVKDISKDEVITKENIRSIRPSNGLSPIYYKDLLGRHAKNDIPFGTPLNMDLFY
ncbi:MAG: pseudaminic acid synthase [Agathobacter sp.]|nr:pseudaminic acid synthase [Agathobacter sp.]